MSRALVSAAFLLVGAGCSNPFEADHVVTLAVSDVEAPAQLAPGSELVVTLTVVTGGCRAFERLDAERSASRITLVARGRDSSGPGRTCPTDIRYETRAYRAPPPFVDPLTIVVRQPDGTELTHEVRVR